MLMQAVCDRSSPLAMDPTQPVYFDADDERAFLSFLAAISSIRRHPRTSTRVEIY